jgi:hypothetical protein
MFTEAVSPIFRGTCHKWWMWEMPTNVCRETSSNGATLVRGICYLTVCQGHMALDCKCDLATVSDRFQAFVNGNEPLVPVVVAESAIRKDSVIRNYSVTTWKWSSCGVTGPSWQRSMKHQTCSGTWVGWTDTSDVLQYVSWIHRYESDVLQYVSRVHRYIRRSPVRELDAQYETSDVLQCVSWMHRYETSDVLQ